MLLEASFRANINLPDECLQIQTCISESKVIVFCVTPIVPDSFMIISSINVLVKLFLMVGGFGGRLDVETAVLGGWTQTIYGPLAVRYIGSRCLDFKKERPEWMS